MRLTWVCSTSKKSFVCLKWEWLLWEYCMRKWKYASDNIRRFCLLKSKIRIVVEEVLSELVRLYPWLYDKAMIRLTNVEMMVHRQRPVPYPISSTLKCWYRDDDLDTSQVVDSLQVSQTPQLPHTTQASDTPPASHAPLLKSSNLKPQNKSCSSRGRWVAILNCNNILQQMLSENK